MKGICITGKNSILYQARIKSYDVAERSGKADCDFLKIFRNSSEYEKLLQSMRDGFDKKNVGTDSIILLSTKIIGIYVTEYAMIRSTC